MWILEKVPSDWLKGVITKLGKKGDFSFCENNRGITLRCVASKLFQIIIITRLSDGIETTLRENQCGFRKNRSCTDQLFSLRVIMERALEYNLPLCINFIDFKAAFDSVNRDYIWSALEHYGLPEKYINIFKAFYSNTESAVRVDDDLTDWFKVESGTGQGDIQAPSIFNIVLNWVMEQAISEKSLSEGFLLQRRRSSRYPAVFITDLDYADDIAVLDCSAAGLQETTSNIANAGKAAGLRIGVNKTKTMLVGKFHSQRPYHLSETLDIEIDGQLLEQVNHFRYLGSTISSDGSIDKEINVRIGVASNAFNALNNVWRNRGICLPTKIKIYECGVITPLLYGCATWALKQRQLQRLDGFHHNCLRRILKVRYFDHVSNVEIRRRTGCCSLGITIRYARLLYFGHVARMPNERFPKYLLDWIPTHGSRSVGRPRHNLLKTIEDDLEMFLGDGCDLELGKCCAADRSKWRHLLKSATSSLSSREQADSSSDD